MAVLTLKSNAGLNESNNLEFCSVTAKGQIVIPKALRALLGINENDKLACFSSGGFLVLKKVDAPDFKAEFEVLANQKTQLHQTPLQANLQPKSQGVPKVESVESLALEVRRGGGHSDVMEGVRRLHESAQKQAGRQK